MKANIILSLILAGSLSAHAQESKEESQKANASTLKVTDVQKKDETADDLDQEITNAKLRAESGSKSKHSAQLSLSYNGGSLEKPTDKNRPKLTKGSTVEDVSKLSGDVSYKYRFSARDSLSLSTGVSVITPFHSDDTPIGERSQLEDPSVSYSRAFRTGAVQNILSVGVGALTTKASQASNAKASASVSYTGLTTIGTTGLSLGAAVVAGNTFYGDDADTYTYTNKAGLQDEGSRDDYLLALYPFAEYELTDKVSLRTVFRWSTYIHFRGEKYDTFAEDDKTQSVGVGYALTRDIYLYPNVQFNIEDNRADKTNVALSTTINMF